MDDTEVSVIKSRVFVFLKSVSEDDVHKKKYFFVFVFKILKLFICLLHQGQQGAL